jgi:hypothetical protein
MLFKRLAMVAIVITALATAACGGGGGGAVPSASGGGSTAAPTQAPVAQTVPISGGGITGSLSVTANGTLTPTASTTSPVGIGTLSLRRPQTAVTGSALLYITLSSSNTTITQIGGSFTLASAPTQSVFLAFWNPGTSEWEAASATPATISGTTATFATITLNPQVAANPNAYFALYTSSGSLPTPVPSASPTPTLTPTTAPSGAAAAACTQTLAAATSTVTVATTFFTSIIPNGHTICISAWDLSSDIDTALATALSHGASVTVITPFSENSSNIADLRTLTAAGAHAAYEYTTTATPNPTAAPTLNPSLVTYQHAPMDIHAKFAIVDGVTYMDGHNWFTTDVVVQDAYAADSAAIQNDLVNFPVSPPSGSGTTGFTTDKQVSLQAESTYLQSVAIPAISTGGANEYDFITESFNPNNATGDYNDDVYTGMCQISLLPSHPTMKVILEEESGYSTAAKTALQNLLTDPSALVVSNDNGHEKISMIRLNGTPVSAWFGSSNATTTDLFDWGMTTTDPTLLGALASYFDTVEFAHATAISGSAATPACGTIHP